ncbi:phosphoribosylanthranilate isomerase [Brevibacillus migulae]|uniref:phosphoribosylanthranilate isomerase n=1 Tax=Brevibacillus migulae TaxID=1644114 RepID=UPI00106E5CEA|nr:phosphoribosylanthranilate isomerase [Brevibacillus migulae]
MNTKVKICGLRNKETLALLTELQVDYAGFVFTPSKRQVTAEQAGAMMASVPNRPAAVGVFVNPTLSELEQTLAQAPLDVIQLHGQESAEYCEEVKKRFALPVWKAVPVGEEGPLAVDLTAFRPHIEAFLFDTHDTSVAGGTGRRFSWAQIPLLADLAGEATVVIAGGITVDNVGELVSQYAPTFIDLSSGVETDGAKDPEKIKKLMQRVRKHEQSHTITNNAAE